MKTIGLTDEGDFRFENGDFVVVDGPMEVAQCIGIDIGTQIEEWFLDESKGADHDILLGKSTDDEARDEVIRILQQEERVKEIVSVTITTDKQTRTREIHYVVRLYTNELLQEAVSI